MPAKASSNAGFPQRSIQFIQRTGRKHPLATAFVAGFVLCTAAIFLVGRFYWSAHPGSISWQECVYSNAACSTAAGTWALAAFGIFTFAAAYRAVFWAKQAYHVEVDPRLGQSVCAHHGKPGHPADKTIFLTANQQVLFRRPALLTDEALKKEYVAHPNAFENLGRSALSDVRVKMHIRDAEGAMSGPIDVMVGNIKCDREIHLVVYVSTIFKPVEIMWSSATERGLAIEFFAESSLSDNLQVGVDPLAQGAGTPEQIRLPLIEPTTSNSVVEAHFQSNSPKTPENEATSSPP